MRLARFIRTKNDFFENNTDSATVFSKKKLQRARTSAVRCLKDKDGRIIIIHVLRRRSFGTRSIIDDTKDTTY